MKPSRPWLKKLSLAPCYAEGASITDDGVPAPAFFCAAISNRNWL